VLQNPDLVNATSAHADYLDRLQRAQVLAEHFADRLFADMAASLNRLDDRLPDRHDLMVEMFDILFDGNPDDYSEAALGERMSATEHAAYLIGVSIGRRLCAMPKGTERSDEVPTGPSYPVGTSTDHDHRGRKTKGTERSDD
jgi:hypothetical protein